MDEVTACRSVLIEVLTILGKDLDKLAVIGGWVPELTFPHQGHVGSLDVDLALEPTFPAATKRLPLNSEESWRIPWSVKASVSFETNLLALTALDQSGRRK